MTNIANAVKEVCNTVGAGPLTLAGAESGFTTWAQGLGSAPIEVYYTIIDRQSNDQEWGIGNFDGVATITRSVVRDVLVQGSYQQGSQSPIYLSGNSEVSCTFTRGAFEDLLPRAEAAASYVPSQADVTVVIANDSLTVRTPLLSVIEPNGDAYDESLDQSSVVTVGSLQAIPRPIASADNNYTLQRKDANGTIYAGRGAATGDDLVIYLPTEQSEVWPAGTRIDIVSWIFDRVVVQGVTGVNIGYRADAGAYVIKNGVATLHYIVADSWILSGDIEAE